MENKLLITCDFCQRQFKSKSGFTKHKNAFHSQKDDPVIVNNVNIDNSGLNIGFEDDVTSKISEDLPNFDMMNLVPLEMKKNFALIISGSRNSGKSTLIAAMYPVWKQVFDMIVFYSYSMHNDIYKFVEDPKFDDFNPQSLKDILLFQKKTENKLKILIIFDDLVSSKVKYNDEIMQVFVRGRNSNLSIVVSTQIFKLINKNSRGNADVIMISRTNSAENRKTLVESVLTSVTPPMSIKNNIQKITFLDKWLQKHTDDFNFVVIKCNDSNEPIFKFKVQM